MTFNCKMLNSSNRAVLHVEHSLMLRVVAYMKGILNETWLDNEERRFEEDAVMETCKLIYQLYVMRSDVRITQRRLEQSHLVTCH